MGRIFLNWVMSVLAGGIIAGILTGAAKAGGIALICIIMAGMSSSPLLIVELISCYTIRKRDSEYFNFNLFSLIKYSGVLLTLIVVQVTLGSGYAHSLEGSFPSLAIFLIWGLPGLVLHFLFLRPGLISTTRDRLKKEDDSSIVDKNL